MSQHEFDMTIRANAAGEGIIKVHDIIESGGKSGLVMEKADGDLFTLFRDDNAKVINNINKVPK